MLCSFKDFILRTTVLSSYVVDLQVNKWRDVCAPNAPAAVGASSLAFPTVPSMRRNSYYLIVPQEDAIGGAK